MLRPVPGTILVVDDQAVVRDVVRIALESAGYHVLEAATPTDALAFAREEPSIDLVMADVVMPEMDAFELAERIAAELPHVPVLYTSGYTDARDEGHFIQKPFTPSELVAKVQEILRGE
jgi:CheY-like chemotaxis protein